MTRTDEFHLHDAFAEAMDRLGPFEPRPALTVAVSGGADSMALALLADGWVRRRHATLRALVVDHGLRPESGEEARTTIGRLDRLGIAATLLPLITLRHGPALAERARIMRYEVLTDACRSAGALHLLLGHHAADQVETMMMRALGGSMTHGLAAMPALSETRGVRLLRPLLTVRPGALRQLLQHRAVAWVEDPSNHDLKALRPRLRHRLAGHMADAEIERLTLAARETGIVRAHEEAATAVELASRVSIWPEGYALLSPGRIGTGGLARLMQTIAGAAYAPSVAQIADLAARPRPATVAGVRILPAGRTGDGLLLVREEASIASTAAACPNVVWDGRFRLIAEYAPPMGTMIGKLGQDATRFRRQSCLPSAVLRSLPAIWFGKTLAAVPHLGYAIDNTLAGMSIVFSPRKPLAGPPFVPA